MTNAADPAVLDERVGQLDDEAAHAVRRYWNRVVREIAAEPVARPITYPAPFSSDIRRERRQVRQAMGRVAAAGRLAAVVELHPASVSAASVVTGGEAA